MTSLATAAVATPNDGKIVCLLDDARVHSIQVHLRDNWPDVSLADYQTRFPDAPILSDAAAARIRQVAAERAAQAAAATVAATPAAPAPALALATQQIVKQAFHEVFELGNVKAAKRANGEVLMIDVMTGHSAENLALVPDIDPNYVFSIEETKDCIIALALNMPCYIWGFHGTGKTTIIEQVHARVKRSLLRVQHTINTEEAHIVGQWTVRGGDTVYQPGPLAMAMLHGWTYLADEYDFAPASVTSVYQSVLEGKPLLIKDAPVEYRIIKPHPNFRFFATGNTNGVGDETGLYQGTQMGNAANFSRFGITIEMGYMPPKMEAIVIANQSSCSIEDAEKIVEFCGNVRKAYAARQIGSTISPREAINAAILSLARANWRAGLERAYLARCSRVDRQVIDQYAQRIWGN